MKSFAVLFLSLSLLFALQAQDKAVANQPLPFNLQDNLEAIANLSPGSVGGVGFDLRYEGLKGHPLLYPEWYPAYIQLEGKLYQDERVQYVVNLETNFIIARFTSGVTTSFPLGTFEEIHFQKDGSIVPFVILADSKSGNKTGKAKICALLADGSYRLLKQYQKFFKPADYKGGYSSNVRYDEYREEYHYLVQEPNGELQKVKLKKKALVKAFPQLEKELNAFSKSNKDALETEAGLIRFFESLEEK